MNVEGNKVTLGQAHRSLTAALWLSVSSVHFAAYMKCDSLTEDAVVQKVVIWFHITCHLVPYNLSI
jgi:hypothetical protein